MGEVLFWSIKQCVGAMYTPEVHLAWVKIYSRMLRTMVPVAVAYELKDGSGQQKRFLNHSIPGFPADPNSSTLENKANTLYTNASTSK
ncbi:hypothetical protein EON65_46525 [archaeon]|nr:MAG: hypothetical protein EON65_46525 [archaeon]